MLKTKVQYITISEEAEGQRIDNFLFHYLKSMPKSRLYRLLRTGEIRVNKKRVAPSYRLNKEDSLRLPPLKLEENTPSVRPSDKLCQFLQNRILFEDEGLFIINKPTGLAVHGGSGLALGLIETLRFMYPNLKHLELAHRLDLETSGCLMVTKKRSVLRQVHALLREGKIQKIYHTFTKGQWQSKHTPVDLPLRKNILKSGERMVHVTSDGKPSLTLFSSLKSYRYGTLMAAELKTGRTHQIRVHAASMGHPIAGDEKYGDKAFNKLLLPLGLKRLFLHAYALQFTLPSYTQPIKMTAPLDEDLVRCLKALE